MKKIFNLVIIPVITIIMSIIFGIASGDYFFGTITLIFGFLNAYYMVIGKWYNYIYGILFALCYAYMCGRNGLFGWVFFTFVFYVPFQVLGMISWFKNKKNDVVEMRSLNFKKATLVCGFIVVGSLLFGYLLSLIPSQHLSFLDGTTQMFNVFGIFLSLFRLREAWYVGLINNFLDLLIWIINDANYNSDSYMMLVVSVVYLVLNIVGIIEWIKIEKEQKNKKCSL